MYFSNFYTATDCVHLVACNGGPPSDSSAPTTLVSNCPSSLYLVTCRRTNGMFWKSGQRGAQLHHNEGPLPPKSSSTLSTKVCIRTSTHTRHPHKSCVQPSQLTMVRTYVIWYDDYTLHICIVLVWTSRLDNTELVYRMRLNFHRTKLSWIANLLNIRGFYFCGYWEQIDMVDHLVPGNLHN